MQSIVAVAALTAATLLSAPAQAAGSSGAALSPEGLAQRQAQVRFDDLDLGSPGGRAVMLRRIEAAAEQVCGPRPSSIRDLGPQLAFDRCVRISVGAAVGKVGQAATAQAATRVQAAGSGPAGRAATVLR